MDVGTLCPVAKSEREAVFTYTPRHSKLHALCFPVYAHYYVFIWYTTYATTHIHRANSAKPRTRVPHGVCGYTCKFRLQPTRLVRLVTIYYCIVLYVQNRGPWPYLCDMQRTAASSSRETIQLCDSMDWLLLMLLLLR